MHVGGIYALKKAKTLETKLRQAIRMIWSRSPERMAIKRAAIYKSPEGKVFNCPLCGKTMPDYAGEVDHVEAVGPLTSWKYTTVFIERMFFSSQMLVCKPCHASKTQEDRAEMRRQKRANGAS